MSAATSRAERAEANYVERLSVAEHLSSSRERGETLSIDTAQDPHNVAMFKRFAEQYGANSASAMVMFDAEIARQGLRPNRTFSNGTALPASFNDIHRQHEIHAAGSQVNPSLEGVERVNSGRLTDIDPNVSPATVPVNNQHSTVRAEIRAKASAMRRKSQSAKEGFDANAEIVNTPDGTLATKRSLFVKSGRQVAADAGVSFDAAKSAAENLVEKLK
jgi:conjugal transfer mating pair stabilization protein TraG